MREASGLPEILPSRLWSSLKKQMAKKAILCLAPVCFLSPASGCSGMFFMSFFTSPPALFSSEPTFSLLFPLLLIDSTWESLSSSPFRWALAFLTLVPHTQAVSLYSSWLPIFSSTSSIKFKV